MRRDGVAPAGVMFMTGIPFDSISVVARLDRAVRYPPVGVYWNARAGPGHDSKVAIDPTDQLIHDRVIDHRVDDLTVVIETTAKRRRPLPTM
jgi:hypothetical protein